MDHLRRTERTPAKGGVFLISSLTQLLLLFFSPSVVKIPRAKNIKLKAKLEWLEVRFFVGGSKALVY